MTDQASIIPESAGLTGAESLDNRIFLLNIPPEAIPIPVAHRGR
jgi:hypothetical protein